MKGTRDGREGNGNGKGDGNRDGGWDGSEDEYGNEHEGRDGGENRSVNEDDVRHGGGGERKPGTYGVVLEEGRKTRQGGARQRVISNHSRKTQRPNETVESCGRSEPRDGRRGIGSGRAEERRISARTSDEL